ncbi:MAG: sigma-70 family RNA polymerase sigma factor [Planctomycetota bacterium]
MSADSDLLLDRIEAGDEPAIDELFARYRPRLRNLVALRLDPRLSARVDASDVVQDAFATAADRVGAYARERSLPFYPWLRQLAIDRIVELHRLHIQAQRRSVRREYSPDAQLSTSGQDDLVQRLAALCESPSRPAQRREAIALVQAAIEQLSAVDREVLALRYLEQLSAGDAASVLGISKNAFAQRHLRALRRIRSLLSVTGGDDGI